MKLEQLQMLGNPGEFILRVTKGELV